MHEVATFIKLGISIQDNISKFMNQRLDKMLQVTITTKINEDKVYCFVLLLKAQNLMCCVVILQARDVSAKIYFNLNLKKKRKK